MAGQRVFSRFSRNHKKIADDAGSPRNQQSSPPSPIKNPFKRKRRWWRWWSNSSIATKSLLVGFCCCCLVFLADTNRPGLSPEIPNDGNTTPQKPHLNLRPAYLNDDGVLDEEKYDGNDDDDNNDDNDDNGNDGNDGNGNEGGGGNDDNGNDGNGNEGGGGNGNDDNGNDGNGNGGNDGNDDNGNEGGEEENDNPDADEEGEELRQEQKVRLQSPSSRDHKRKHKIPRTLIFTHYKNLLELVPSKLLRGENEHTDIAVPDTTNAYQNLTSDELEEFVLATNVRHSINVHNQSATGEDEELKIIFWTDDDCIRSLERTRPKLVSYFKTEKEGMYKADICRGAALLEHGGFYLDVDVGVRHDLWRDLRPQTEFVTSRVHQQSKWVGKGFFQAIMGASPESPVLKRYLELFEQHYDGTSRIHEGPLGVLLLFRAWDQVRNELEEAPRAPKIASEFYHEVLFQENGPLNTGSNKGVLSPAPTWGKRRACHFVVAGIANKSSNIELVLKGKESEENEKNKPVGLQIPVLSRIPGSRMCIADPKESETTDGGHKNYNATRMIESMKWWERT